MRLFLPIITLTGFLFLPFLGAQSSSARPPISTDQPGAANSAATVAPGVFQVETGVAVQYRDFTENGLVADQFSFQTPAVLRIGLFDDFEFRFATGGLTHQRVEIEAVGQTPLEQKDTGFASPLVGFKWHLLDAREDGLRPSTGLLLMLNLPAGSRQFRPEEVEPSLTWALDFSLPAGNWLTTNVGLAVPLDGATEDRFAQGLLAVAGGRALSPEIGFYLEFFTQGPGGPGGPWQYFLDGGMTFLIHHDLQLDFSIFRGLTDASTDWLATFGVSFRFHD